MSFNASTTLRRDLIAGLLAIISATHAWSQGKPNILWMSGGHSNSVTSIAYSADGQMFATGSSDRTVKVWRSDGRLLETLSIPYDINGQLTDVRAVAFSPDGTRVAAGVEQYNATSQTYFGSVRMWRISDGSLVQSLTGNTAVVTSVAFSPNGQLIASGSADRTVRIWSVPGGALISNRTDHAQVVNTIAFSPNGLWLASGSDDTTVKLYRTSDWSVQRTLAGHTSSVRCLAFSPDSTLIGSGSLDQSVRIWNVGDGSILHAFNNAAGVRAVAFTPDGQTVASGGQDTSIRLWDLQTGSLSRTLVGHTGGILALAFAPSGLILASASGYPEYGVRQWDPALGTLTRMVTNHSSSIYDFKFTASLQLISAGDTTARFWRQTDGVSLRRFDGGQTAQQIALSPDGNMLAMPGPGNTVRILRTSDGALVKTLTGHTQQVTGLAFSHDGTMLATGAYFDGSNDKIKLWRVSDWSLTRELSGQFLFGPFDFITFSPNDALLTSICEGEPAVWRVADGALLHTFGTAQGPSRFSPNSQLLAVCTNPVRVYRASDWTQVATLGNQGQALSFTPDGSYLASAGSSQIQFWRTSDWTLQRFYNTEMGSPGFGVTALEFSRDGRLFAFGRFDATVAVARNPFGVLPIPSPGLGGG